MLDKTTITDWFRHLQQAICSQLENADGQGLFREDFWKRPGGGYGYSRVIQGRHIEKGGVNFSAVHGLMPENISKALNVPPGNFLATGVSIVLHPANPHVPIIHMNVRYFEMDSGIWWFGGGIDLTPHYIDPEDAKVFHQALKRICDQNHPEYYPEFKKWADDYFFIPHRNETRGIGGIFFDRLSERPDFTKEQRFTFVQDVGRTFAPLYISFLNKHKDAPFNEREKQWQYLRRGRYVEFNLVYDKGTKFGLDTEGRTESILMSLPPLAAWEYDFMPEAGSKEDTTRLLLKKEVDWINYEH